jgi:hypothetical protein
VFLYRLYGLLSELCGHYVIVLYPIKGGSWYVAGNPGRNGSLKQFFEPVRRRRVLRALNLLSD